MRVIGCTGPPALPGILRTRPARLLEWARRMDCGLLLARPPPGLHRGGRGGAQPHLHHGPRGPGGPEPERARRRTTSPVRPSAASGTILGGAGTTLGAATSGRGWCRRSGYDQRRHAPHPSPPTAPVRPGMVPQCRQDRWNVGGYLVTTRSPTLAGVGQCSLADGHGPSEGLSSASRIVCT
jgi:hypothetical protein